MKKKSLSMNQIMILSLTAIVVGILGCAIAFFLRTYQQSLIRNAQTDGRRTISQVTSTVDSYLGDMNNVMEILASELVTPSEDREHFFDTFLKIRPDVVAVTIYDETGHLMSCYSLDHEVRPVVLENLSFAWTMIDQDGKALLYDAQLEYAYLYMFHRDPVDMFGAEGQDGMYRGFRYYFPEE